MESCCAYLALLDEELASVDGDVDLSLGQIERTLDRGVGILGRHLVDSQKGNVLMVTSGC